MKRLIAFLLALTVALGAVPAQAQTALGRVTLQTGTAPVPVPRGLVPAAGIFLPALSAPSLTASVPALTPLPAAFTPVPSLIVAPVAAAAATAVAATPLEVLRSVAAPEAVAVSGFAFDGSITRSAASVAEPPSAPEPSSLLQRYRASHGKNPVQDAFGKAMFATSIAAASVPVLWGAVPAMKYVYAVTAADILMLAILLPLSVGTAIWSRLRRSPQTAAKPPPSRRAKLAAIAIGVMLGLGAAVAPYQATGPAVEVFSSVKDIRVAPAERASVRWISGGATEDEAAKVLALNPVGREIMSKLTDRGGVLRMPPFFVSKQDDSYAQHESFFDGVYLSQNEILSRGWTVEQFLKDPALQRRLVREMSSTVVHELIHAVQGRRPPWTKGYFTHTLEAEQEAFLRTMLYRLAELERDPAARNDGDHSWLVPDAADDLDGFLKSIADMYEKNIVVGEPYFNAFLASQRERWPAFRVHMYHVLAARAETPGLAKMYLDKAKAAAKEAGIPEPSALVASR